MKKCPTCNRTFTDDALSFCLNDGSPLISVGAEPQSYDPGATVQYNPGRETNPPPTPGYTPAPFAGQQASWSPTPPVGGMQGQPPPKKSKALFWILGIVGAVVVLGIGGIVLALVLVGMSSSNANNENENSANTNSNQSANSANTNNSNTNDSNTNTSSTSSKTFVAKDDFSSSTWWIGSNAFGTTVYVNGQYQLTGASATGYVSVYGPTSYKTQDATTRLTARNVSGVEHPLGFGLAVFGEIKGGQLDDYAFLIRTGDDPAFRIVEHASGKETTLVDWTSASQVRTGTSMNQLEVRANSTTLDFYINGQFAKTVAHSGKNTAGIVGVYTSGLATIAFDDLEIYK